MPRYLSFENCWSIFCPCICNRVLVVSIGNVPEENIQINKLKNFSLSSLQTIIDFTGDTIKLNSFVQLHKVIHRFRQIQNIKVLDP